MNRQAAAQQFIDGTDWRGNTPSLLAGDASLRRYFRLRTPSGHSAVLMDSPPEGGDTISPFLAIARHLAHLGLSAPVIYDGDPAAGFLLLEDLGDALFARVLVHQSQMETELYEAAADVLLALHAGPCPPDVLAYDTAAMAPLAGLAAQWYSPDAAARPALEAACTAALNALPTSPGVTVLRDFHAENLIWLPERKGAARVGLLDFQDASSGHMAYDLASLLRDARRDVSQPAQDAAATRFAKGAGIAPDALSLALATQGAQRNLRILGVFARLSLHFGKPQYIDLIPRVWANLMTELAHPDLAPLRAEVLRTLPPPNPEHLKDLKDRCGTIPTLA